MSHLVLKYLGQTVFITHPKPTLLLCIQDSDVLLYVTLGSGAFQMHTLCSTPAPSPAIHEWCGQTMPVQVCWAGPQAEDRPRAPPPLPCDVFGKSPGSSQQNIFPYLSDFKCSGSRIRCLKSCNQVPAIRQELGDSGVANSKTNSNSNMAT